MIIHALNLGGNKRCLIVVILIRTFTYFVLEGKISSFVALIFPLWREAIRSHASRLKRLTGELISSGFYTRNQSWLQTLSGSQMKR